MSKDLAVVFPEGPVPLPISQDWLIRVRDLLKSKLNVTCRERSPALDVLRDTVDKPVGVVF